jgi:hypothetical protein
MSQPKLKLPRACASREADLRQGIVKNFAFANSPVIPDTSRVAIWLEPSGQSGMRSYLRASRADRASKASI